MPQENCRVMDEVIHSSSPEPAPPADAMSPEQNLVNQHVDLATRRSERQQELLASMLANPDPKAAIVGSAVMELLEFTAMLKSAISETAAATSDPAERLAKVSAPLQMYATFCRLAQKLP